MKTGRETLRKLSKDAKSKQRRSSRSVMPVKRVFVSRVFGKWKTRKIDRNGKIDTATVSIDRWWFSTKCGQTQQWERVERVKKKEKNEKITIKPNRNAASTWPWIRTKERTIKRFKISRQRERDSEIERERGRERESVKRKFAACVEKVVILLIV